MSLLFHDTFYAQYSGNYEPGVFVSAARQFAVELDTDIFI